MNLDRYTIIHLSDETMVCTPKHCDKWIYAVFVNLMYPYWLTTSTMIYIAN